MQAFPNDVSAAQTVCALRFLGYEYEEATRIATGRGFSHFTEPVVKSLTLHVQQEDNLAAFFALQRYLHKWGGEHLTKYADEHIAYDFLFLHLYRVETPRRFTHEEYDQRWRRDYLPRIEPIAAHVRASFRRVGRGKKVS